MYEELNDRLKKALNLRMSTVAVALSNDKPNFEKLNKKLRLCEMP
jgi:uncharacterized protein (DUF169 family)